MVVRPSYTIRHKYPGPLKTYDGEERCEPRMIRLSDLRSSQLDLILSMCEKQDERQLKCEPEEGECCKESCTETSEEVNEEIKQEPCEEIPEVKEEQLCNSEIEENLKKYESQIFINMLPQQKSSIKLESICSESLPTPEQLIRMELRARTLYEVETCQDQCAPSWESLTSTEKLRFHWQAHAGVKLQEKPFDNFRLCYLKNRPKNSPKMGIRQIRSDLKLHWSNMDRSERMPFIVQSLLYQVSMGAIEPTDHCAVREFFQKMK
ncbi:hypothetical protein KR200_003165 [Drosophila serrata]|nr:hypothetical protein KR200_003165 [Drosophila serrata]